MAAGGMSPANLGDYVAAGEQIITCLANGLDAEAYRTGCVEHISATPVGGCGTPGERQDGGITRRAEMTDKAGSLRRVSHESLEALCVEAMRRAGMTDADAHVTADVLVTTDTWGTHTHGTKQLRGLLKNFRDGRMDVNGAGGVDR